MTTTERPYFNECRVCGDGLLRFWICKATGSFILVCDECESIWSLIGDLADDPTLKPDYAYPDFPGEKGLKWAPACLEDIRDYDLEYRIGGYSV
ncbi:MAG: hypothetical protein ACI9QL_002593 [Candidatus Omnitrophota bacterium]|jgi:hypothetical protein